MKDESPNLSRISKLFADRDSLPTEEGLRKRQQFAVTLVCGADVAASYISQLSVVTAAEIATRCFPDTVSVVLPAKVDSASMLFWPNLEDRPSFGGLLRQIVGTHNVVPERGDLPRSNVLLFGDAPEIEGALRVGLQAVLIDRHGKHSSNQHPHIIRDLSPLPDLIAPQIAR